MNTTELTIEEATKLLDGLAISSSAWQSLEGGNQKFWVMPPDFNVHDYLMPKDSLYRFSDWGTTGGDGNKVVRLWSKW